MTSAFIVSDGGDKPSLRGDLAQVGVDTVGESEHRDMVSGIVRSSPDVVVCYETHPSDAFFASTKTLNQVAPRPVVVFTPDPDADNIERATNACIHAYIINGYSPLRLRSIIFLAQSRFRYDQLLREELVETKRRFSERQLVDKAKGILMRLRNIPEDEAYQTLRTAAMQSKQRIGQVARQVIEASKYAEAVNRAGQLRMLSQRLVRLYAQVCLGDAGSQSLELCKEAASRVEANLAILERILSKATFGDLLGAVVKPWTALKTALAIAPDAGRLGPVDDLAEEVLTQADKLTQNLEAAGFAKALRIINVSGRQRMLSQRIAKFAVMRAAMSPRSASVASKKMHAAVSAFVQGLAFLKGLPLSTPELQELLQSATQTWDAMQSNMSSASDERARVAAVATNSDVLLATFERLTDTYERIMQMLAD